MGCFHFFWSSFISSSNVLSFLVYKSCTSLVKFMPQYFILFDTVLNGIVSLILCLDCSLLLNRIITDFCVDFVSCKFAEFISLIVFHVDSSSVCVGGCLCVCIFFMSSANRDTFTSLLPIWMVFLPFSIYLLLMAHYNSITMLKRSSTVKVGIFVLFSVFHHCMKLAVAFS